MSIWVVVTSNQLKRLKQKFLLAKLPSLGQVNFVLTILFVLTLASDTAILYGNDAFSIFGLSTKKRYSSSSQKVLVFQKIYLKVKSSKYPVIVT